MHKLAKIDRMWSQKPNWFMRKLFNAHNCISPDQSLQWHKIGASPILLRHALLHIQRCCDEAQFVPKSITVTKDQLQPFAFAVASAFSIPVIQEPSQGQAVLLLAEHKEEASKMIRDEDLGVAFLTPTDEVET